MAESQKTGETYGFGAKVDGKWVRITVPLLGTVSAGGERGEVADRADARPCPGVSYGRDFAAVNWYGTIYTFAPRQRLAVAALFDARDKGFEWLSQEVLLEAAESDCQRLRDLFRGNSAWGTMIVSALTGGGPAGAYRLGDPPT